ncbi:MAG: DUF349 domain-containing protein [Schleiferiaceae bacterium]|nr:DUF349 domain-containing protein [Schleiferiaceae bacterium]
MDEKEKNKAQAPQGKHPEAPRPESAPNAVKPSPEQPEDAQEQTTQEETKPAPEKATPAAESAPKSPEKASSTAPEKPAETPEKDSVEKAAPKAENTPASTDKSEASTPADAAPSEASPAAQAADELDQEDNTEEIQGDDNEHEDEHPEELQMPEYGDYTPEQLVAAAEKLLKEQPIQKIKEHFEAIRKHLLRQLNEERQQKLEKFKAEGGHEIDFAYQQPLRDQFRDIYGRYRKQRRQYYDELRQQLHTNLEIKKGLIEKLKALIGKEESIGDTFKEFNALMQEWRNTGPVPRAESRDLWRTWHHHVENFYEFIKINKELRDLDYQKNQKAKEELIEKARALLSWEDAPKAFRELQKLHQEWKHTGPVAPEKREALWEQFSELTRQLREKREAFYEQLRARRGELVEQKRQIVEEMKALGREFSTHRQWQDALQKMQALTGRFKKIGRLNHPQNDEVWEAYRETLRAFNHAKNDFYKELKKTQKAHLQAKKALVEKAEALKDSTDWGATAAELKKLQAEWKKTGHVARKDGEKVWKHFRTACDHFFERLAEHNKVQDQAREGHYEQKKALLSELENLDVKNGESQKMIGHIKRLIGEWKKVGPVPRGKGKIEKRFSEVLDAHFKALDVDRQQSNRLRVENKVAQVAQSGGAQALERQKREVGRKLEEAQRELNQLETNLSFFSSSDPKSPIVKEAKQKLEKQQNQIDRLREEQKMLSVKKRKLKEAETAGEEKALTADDNSEA